MKEIVLEMSIDLLGEWLGNESFTVELSDEQYLMLVDYVKGLDDDCFDEEQFAKELPMLHDLIEQEAQTGFDESVEPQDEEELEDYSFCVVYPEDVCDWFDILGVEDDEVDEDL